MVYWHPRPDVPDCEQVAIVGGERGRDPKHEYYIFDDSHINELVGAGLRKALPYAYGGKIQEQEPSMEWVNNYKSLSCFILL
jgi:hypothetical protein